REGRREREDQRREREAAAVHVRRWWGRRAAWVGGLARVRGLDVAHRGPRYAAVRPENGRFGTIVGPAVAGVFTPMPNIKQQKKRVRTAAEERLENLRYSSTIKTLAKRLAAAVEEGDAATVEAEYKGLVRLIDRAVT